jgi:tetratricopeptide (TPR) repeat protein
MKTMLAAFFVLLFSLALFGQSKIVIPAGTPEDKALAEIGKEADQDKRITMLEAFVKDYSSNPAAVAYGNWQLSQQFVTSDPKQAMEYGDKALAAMPDVLDILQTQADLAQQTKQYSKVVDYAVRSGAVIKGIEKRPKPDNMSGQEFASQLATEKAAAQPIYDYMATAAYNAMASEQDPKQRITEIERYTEVFQGTKLSENANLLAVATYQELNDMTRLTAFGEKALAADPNNAFLLTLLANAFAEDQKGTNLSKADTYARKAIELVKADTNIPEENRQITEGFAHQILGYTLLRQDKTPAAIIELKAASTMLKSDSAKYSVTLYRLGFAYAKANQVANAKLVLGEAVNVEGPFKDASKDLLAKVSAARPAAKK